MGIIFRYLNQQPENRNEPVNINDKGKRPLEQEDNNDPRKKGKVVYDQGPNI